jgi:hypothetical protein
VAALNSLARADEFDSPYTPRIENRALLLNGGYCACRFVHGYNPSAVFFFLACLIPPFKAIPSI